ncbi:MAG: response regulator [Verrucomicrobiota bacterium]
MPSTPPTDLADENLPPRILIIDDNLSIHRDFKLVLVDEIDNAELDADEERLYGAETKIRATAPAYQLEHANSGLEGVEKVQASLSASCPFQMAFVDIRMPGIDGVETIERIWRIDPRIQMVICTAYADYSQEDLLQRLGQTDKLLVLKKPFDSIEVTQLAGTLVAKWFLTRQAELKLEEMELLVSRRTQKVLELQRQEQRITRERQDTSGGAPAMSSDETSPQVESTEDEEAADVLESRLPVILLVSPRDSSGRTLSQQLAANYRIIEARSEQALAKAQEAVPDVIIVDSIGTNTDGLELCRNLKTTLLTSHIPVILLGAQHSERSQLQALEAGVDECFSKPVDVSLLVAHLKGMVTRRPEIISQAFPSVVLQPRDLVASQSEVRFLQQVIAAIEQCLSDFEFDVEQLAKKVAVSRRQLFRKLGAVTNIRPKALIRMVRLKRAAHLLLNSNMTVTEITYAVGFSDVKHFRTLFRDQYGVLPSEFSESSMSSINSKQEIRIGKNCG